MSNVFEKLEAFNNVIYDSSFKDSITTSMPRTFLGGNGDVAIVSSGSSTEKSYLISKGDFWSCGDLKTDDPMGLNVRRVTPLTIGKLSIKNLSSKAFQESLDIRSGVITSQYDDVLIDCYCHSTKNIIIVKIKTKTPRKIICEVSAKNDIDEYKASAILKNEIPYVSRKTANFSNDTRSWTSEVALAIGGDISDIEIKKSSVSFSVETNDNEYCYAFIAVGGGGKTYDYSGKLITTAPMLQAKELLNDINNADEIFKSHLLWWNNYWSKSYVSLSDFEMEKYYYGSLYIMACCSRENKLATGLYGNFITTDNPKWNGDFHLNYNFIAPFYGMYKCNRAEFSKPLADPMIDFIPEGKRRAKEDIKKISRAYITGGFVNKKFFKGRRDIRKGIDNSVLYPVALGPYGVHTWSAWGGYITQMNDCAFTCMGLTAYYFYTLDKEYIQKLKELLVLNVNFFMAWREKEVLPDNSYRYNLWSGAHEGTMEMNSPLVLASIKNILKCLIDAVSRNYITVSNQEMDTWQDFLDNIAEYPLREFSYKTGFKKVTKEVVPLGEKGLNVVKNAATVSLEFIHPGEEMDFKTDERLKMASRNLIDIHKLMDDNIFSQINNLPKIFVHAIRSGYNPNNIVNEFKTLYKNNFMYNYSVRDTGDAHGIEKAGGIEFINSMLIESDMATIKVFPNWIGKDAEFENMLVRGAFLVNSKYSQENQCVEYIEVTSKVQNKISVISPWNNIVVLDDNKQPVNYKKTKESYADIVVTFNAETNKKYKLIKK